VNQIKVYDTWQGKKSPLCSIDKGRFMGVAIPNSSLRDGKPMGITTHLKKSVGQYWRALGGDPRKHFSPQINEVASLGANVGGTTLLGF